MMAKILDDKYYTPYDIVTVCLKELTSTIKANEVTEIIEPSAGDGAFSNRVICTAYDIKPETDNIIQADYLTLDIPYKKGRLVLGNPPYGTHNSLVRKFYKKSVEIADFIAFILPIAQLNNNITLYEFDLIKSIDLGIAHYTDRDLHCCFNIYKRPINCLNSKPDYTLQDVEIIERRRKADGYNYRTGKNKDIRPGYDFAMCNWGSGCLGKVPEYIGQYAQEVYIYVKNPIYKQAIAELLNPDNVREYAKSIAMKRISVMKLYKYFSENIDGIK